MKYKHSGTDHFYRETIELTRLVMERHPSEDLGTHGLTKFKKSGKRLSENAENYLRQLCGDFMSHEFDGIDWPEINYAMMSRTDDVYDDWIEFAKLKGLNSADLQAAGWEMIFGGEFNYVPALQKFY